MIKLELAKTTMRFWIRLLLSSGGLLLVCLLVNSYSTAIMIQSLTPDTLENYLDRQTGSNMPGLQYIVVDANSVLYEYAGGWANLADQKPMTAETTMMAYSMTKTITAVAVLQLVEQDKLGLDDDVSLYLPELPYEQSITIRQLITHTSGIPNPLPLRWVHSLNDTSFNEDVELANVLMEYPSLDFEPGEKYSYSNIGYWLLGKAIEKVTGQTYSKYVEQNILSPLNILPTEMGFEIPTPSLHANGYLAKYSTLNLMKGFVTDSDYWGAYEGNWMQIKAHLLNGPSFGGLIGTAGGFSRFLQDQLHPESVLFTSETKQLFETQQQTTSGAFIPMTLGWHIGEVNGIVYYFKEGGGGGFHCEMRIYPSLGIGSVVMTNSTQFNSTNFLNQIDTVFTQE